MSHAAERRASPLWANVVDNLNDVHRRRRATARPAVEIAEAFRADPVGIFLQNHWVAWARWQNPIEDASRIKALLNVANGTPPTAPDALDLSLPVKIDRALWRSRLERIAAAGTRKKRIGVQRLLAPELIREIRHNAIFVVDDKCIRELRFRMLEQYGSIATLSYATLLLLAPEGPGKTLCKCRLPGCGVFYFPPATTGPGRKKTNYCCPDHLDAGQKQLNSARVRRSKDKSRAKAATKNRRTRI